MEHADETHFPINRDDGYTLGFGGDQVVYADMKLGWEGMNMLVSIVGGLRSFIEIPLLIFKNRDRHYPNLGL